jgi:hypothetical protein
MFYPFRIFGRIHVNTHYCDDKKGEDENAREQIRVVLAKRQYYPKE